MNRLLLLHEAACNFADYMLQHTSKRKQASDLAKWVVHYDRMQKYLNEVVK